MPAKSSVSPFKWIYKHEDTPKPADKEGGAWVYFTGQRLLPRDKDSRTIVTYKDWRFVKSGELWTFDF